MGRPRDGQLTGDHIADGSITDKTVTGGSTAGALRTGECAAPGAEPHSIDWCRQVVVACKGNNIGEWDRHGRQKIPSWPEGELQGIPGGELAHQAEVDAGFPELEGYGFDLHF